MSDTVELQFGDLNVVIDRGTHGRSQRITKRFGHQFLCDSENCDYVEMAETAQAAKA